MPLQEWHEADDAPYPYEVLEQADQGDVLRRAEFALPDPHREVICLVHLEALTCREAASVQSRQYPDFLPVSQVAFAAKRGSRQEYAPSGLKPA